MLEEALEVAIEAAKFAGKSSLEVFDTLELFSVQKKQDIIREKEITLEREIRRRLAERFPDHHIVGEEEGTVGDEQSACTWYIDPIDGTGNFSRGIPQYGVSVALADHDRIVMGVIYQPVREQLFTATIEDVARMNGNPIRVSQRHWLSESDIYYTDNIGTHAPELLAKIVQSLRAKTLALHSVSCTSYDLSLVALGKADGLLKWAEHPWGFAAAGLIVEKAGGKLTDEKGAEWTVKTERLVVSNGLLHDELMPYLR